MIYSGLFTKICGTPAVPRFLPAPATAVFYGAAPKEPPSRFVVVNIIDATPAAHTLEGASALRDGEFQFDTYAENQITARELLNAVKGAFMGQDGKFYGGSLSDNSTIQFTGITADRDAGYEIGAEGYIYRSLLRMTAQFTEAC